MPLQMQLLLCGLVAFALGAGVGLAFRPHAVLSFCVTLLVVLCIHLAGDYVQSGYPPITAHGVAVSLYIAAWPLLLFACLPAFGGTLAALVGCRLLSRRRRESDTLRDDMATPKA
jgi:hypothetical protein